MSKPIPGATYIVLPGDTLTRIAKKAYGEASKWRIIWEANKTKIKSGRPDLIGIGDILFIPPNEEISIDVLFDAVPQLPGKSPDDFTVVINGIELPIKAGRAIRTMDTASDSWTASVSWDKDSLQILKAAIQPYSYAPAQCFIGGQQIINGFVYIVETETTSGGSLAKLQGFSTTKDLVDSVVNPPYEAKKITLQLRAQALCAPYGIPVKFLIGDVEPFDRVTARPEEKVFAHLAKLAAQRGALITSTALGELLITQAASGPPVGSLEEGLPPVENMRAKFDGTKRYNGYEAIGQSPGKTTKSARSQDSAVLRPRFLRFKTNESTAGNIQKAADWRRSKQLADTLTITVPTTSWYDRNNALLKENTIITVKSDTLFLPGGFNFLIRSIEYVFEPGGTRANLSLVPPQAYSGSVLIDPWS
jgi:prophage tail gpP-like protein